MQIGTGLPSTLDTDEHPRCNAGAKRDGCCGDGTLVMPLTMWHHVRLTGGVWVGDYDGGGDERGKTGKKKLEEMGEDGSGLNSRELVCDPSWVL